MDTKKLRQKILDLAIRGKLVPQDPNDEPASVLLERIRAEKERLIKEGKIKRSKKSASDTPHYENEVPFEVPESWEWCQVSDIFELNPKNDVPDDTQSGFIPMVCVDDGFGYAHSFETRPWGEIRKGYSHFQNGDIGIAKISPCFENRKSTIFYDLPNGIGAGTTELTVLRGYCVNTEFFLYLFQSEWYIFEGTKEFKGVVGQQRVNKEIFTTLLIPLPPIEEQNRIVSEIKKWFSLIDTLESAKEDLQTSIAQTKSKILDLAIHGKLVPQDTNDEPAINLLKRINPKFTPCDNAHDTNQLPDSWCWSTLGDVCSFISGYSYSSSEYKKAGIPLVRISDINDGIISLDNCAYIQPQGERNVYLQKGDILIAMSGATTGKMGIYMNEESAILNQRVGVVRVTDSKIISEKYRDYFLYRKSSDILKLAYGGAQPNISGKMICSLLLPLPPYSEQLRIVTKIEELFAVLDEIQKSINSSFGCCLGRPLA